MNDRDENERTAARLRDALSAAADVMGVRPGPERQRLTREPQSGKRLGSWLMPLAAAASMVAIALAAVLVAHLSSADSRASGGGANGGTPAAAQAQASRPEFYLTATYPATGPNVLVFQVRRTDGGAVTGSKTISGANLGWGGYISAAASDRAFYIGTYPCTRGSGIPTTTFYRITVTSAGRISGMAPDGSFKGMVTSMAVSPDGSQMAYGAIDQACAAGGRTLPFSASVHVQDLSTGAVRTWQDTGATDRTLVSRLSWAPDGRSVVVEERQARALTVYRLDTTGSGGSLQAHSTTVLQQNANCSTTCVSTELAGPDGSLIALEYQVLAKQIRLLVVRIPAAAGSHQTVLYRGAGVLLQDIFTDPSGQWVLLWPDSGASTLNGHPLPVAAGWISGGRLHPLPGAGQVFPQGITW